jgi:ADP-ribose pyrophosphatase YjhB (NUDIX family)
MIGQKKKKFRFCPLCATLLQTKTEEGIKRKYCPKCGFVHYLNPTPGAAVIIEEKGKVLLIRRKFDPWKGLWQCPAGFIEWDETPQEAAIRETEEEAGVKVKLTGIFDVRLITEDPRENIVIIFFKGEIVEGIPRSGDDAEEVAWFPLDNLPKFGSRQHKIVLEKLKGEFKDAKIKD